MDEDGRDLVPLGLLVAGLVPDAAEGEPLALERLALDLPVELAVDDAGEGRRAIRAAPPLGRFAATVSPVLHRMRITVEVGDAGRES